MAKSLVLNRRSKAPAEDTAAFGAIAERFRRAGALEQAVSLCREGLQKFPDHVSARVTLGWSLLDLGKYDEARVELEQVMRRAPDNLAAIRGLAELHDRFEHTLNLPMDGPGQWPPPADTIESETVDAPEVDDPVASFEQFEAEPHTAQVVDEPVVDIAAAEAAEPEIVWAPPPVSSESAESPVVASGMSSVREIDAFAGVASVPAPAEPAAVVQDAPIELAAEDLGVSDPTLAALIAEADSLEAAVLEVAEPITLEVSTFDDDLVAELDFGASSIEVVPDPVLSVAEVADESPVTEMPEVIAAAEVVEVPEVAAIAEIPEAFESVAEPPRLAEVIPFEPPANSDHEPVNEPVAAMSTVEIEHQSRNAAVLKTLEHMLARVQARRLELMAESVA